MLIIIIDYDLSTSQLHVSTILVQIGSVDELRSADVDLIGGVHPGAAAVPVDEEVVEAGVLVEICRLHPLRVPGVTRSPGQVVVAGVILAPPVRLYLQS